MDKVTASRCYGLLFLKNVKNFDGVDSEGNQYGFKLIYELHYKDAEQYK